MATRITERASKVADAVLRNGLHAVVFADTMVGARVNAYYPDRFWLVIRKDGKIIHQESTQKRDHYEGWMQDIRENG